MELKQKRVTIPRVCQIPDPDIHNWVRARHSNIDKCASVRPDWQLNAGYGNGFVQTQMGEKAEDYCCGWGSPPSERAMRTRN